MQRLHFLSRVAVSSSFGWGAPSAYSTRANHSQNSPLYTPLSAQQLVSESPPIEVEGLTASCDGGGPLGHPKIYINLEGRDVAQACGYCGLRFIKKKDAHHHH